MTNTEFKACVVCKDVHPATLEFFYKKSSSNDSLQNVCIPCIAKASKKHYEANKEKIKQKTRDRRKRIKPLAHKIILHALEGGCIDCGEKDRIVLDFDHQGDKTYNIAAMVHSAISLDKLEEEISKCVVRCANCHRRKIAKDFNWWRVNPTNNEE